MVDGAGLVLQDRPLVGPARTWSFPRQALIDVLQRSALQHGAELVTGQAAVSATREGTLVLEDGTELTADLVVGADGHRSRIRGSLGLEESVIAPADGVAALLDRRATSSPPSR